MVRRFLDRLVRLFANTRAIMVKDIKTFLRDTDSMVAGLSSAPLILLSVQL